MKLVLNIIELVTAALMVVLILLQNKGVGLSATFGGEGAIYRSKRGVEKGIFVLTIILAVIFVSIGIIQLLI
jgi:preprotein translocase subunit SecG